MTTNWAPRPGDADVQDAASSLSAINFDPNRMDELTFGELESITKGIVVLLERHTKQLSIKSMRAMGEWQKNQDVESMLRVVGVLLDEKVIQKVLRTYAKGAEGKGDG